MRTSGRMNLNALPSNRHAFMTWCGCIFQTEILEGLEARVAAVDSTPSGLPGGPPILLDSNGKAVKQKRIVPKDSASDVTRLGEFDAPVIRRCRQWLHFATAGCLALVAHTPPH